MARSNDGGRPNVVYVDPDEDAVRPGSAAIERAGATVEHVRDAASATDRLDAGGVDCVVSRHSLAGEESGLALLKTVRERHGGVAFVLFTDDGDESLASDAIAAGVTEYVPSRSGEALHRSLVDCVERALGEGEPPTSVDEGLKDQAMDEAPVGITIADATAPDTPMVYINDSFEEMTGYDREDVLGWNCRFLQGSRSDSGAVEQMREAVDAGEEVSVELVNYTADGEPFWNRVDIAPLYNDGELTHFMGFQTDVSERVEAERAAREEAARARRERETVESLLEHLDGVVADVTGAMVEARTRSTAESRLCERLADGDQYALACVAEIDPGSDAAWVSVSAGETDAVETDEFSLDGEGPVARAVESGESVFEDPPESGWPKFGSALADRPLGAIPLRYGDATYGVLIVVAAADAFDEHERGILGAIGHVTATAINAIATQRRLHSDEVVELEFTLAGPDPFVVALSAALDCTFEHVGTVTGNAERTAMFFEVTGATVDEIETALEGVDEDVTCTPITSREERTVVEFEAGQTTLVRTLREHGGHLQSLSVEGGTGRLVVDIDREADPRRVVEAVERQLEGAELSAYRDRERPARTRGDVLKELGERLTERQETALRKAYVGGFFEWPRDTTGEDLAESMGIDRSTFHQHFRAAQRKVLETLYEP